RDLADELDRFDGVSSPVLPLHPVTRETLRGGPGPHGHAELLRLAPQEGEKARLVALVSHDEGIAGRDEQTEIRGVRHRCIIAGRLGGRSEEPGEHWAAQSALGTT